MAAKPNPSITPLPSTTPPLSGDRSGRNGVPNIPISANTASVDPEAHHITFSPTTTSHKASKPPAEDLGMSPSRVKKMSRLRFTSMSSNQSTPSVDPEDDASGSSYSDSYSSDDEKTPREQFVESSQGLFDYCIKDIKLAKYGKKEIEIAEKEMPGLMLLRRKTTTTGDKPLKGARIVGCTHVTAQAAVLIQTLTACGATVRWCSCNVHSTQDEIAASLAHNGYPVFAWKGQTEDDFWWCIEKCLQAPNWKCDMILDDGGDATYLMLQKYPGSAKYMRGVVEESLTGIYRLYQLSKEEKLPMPAINIHDSVVKVTINLMINRLILSIDKI
jgi:adenosylhomocysteinase